MTTVNPNLPINLFSSMPTLPASLPLEVTVDLSSEQIVRAMVVERNVDGVVLEINRQNYLAQGERELQVGQKVNLQVVQTQPRLEFRVLGNSLADRLSKALPLLTRPFDWSQLVGQLQLQTGQTALPPSTVKIYNQLQQLLNPVAGPSVDLRGGIATIVTQLQQLTNPGGTQQGGPVLLPDQVLSQPLLQTNQQISPFDLSQTVTPLIKNLQNQLSLLLLPKQTGMQLPQSWYTETRDLLAPLHQGRKLPQLLVPQRQLLVNVLNQIQEHPKVSPQLSGEVKRILIQIDRQIAQDISPPVIKSEVAVVNSSAVMSKLSVSQNLAPTDKIMGTKVADVSVQLSTEIKQLLSQVPQGQGNKQGVPPELLGRLEGLLSRLQQLPQVAGDPSVILPGVETIVNQLEQLVSQQPRAPQGGNLGVLSQLFGFHLETELLQGKKKAALSSLKLSLLNLQKELGTEADEPLRRLELFQLCKARLAEEQVQFLPLPFNELEEGYLLAERQHQEDNKAAENRSPLQMSLSLRLSALGNIRIDMLYEKEGLHLRLACENREKMHYLQNCADELKESLKAIELQGINFSADAQLPVRQLQQRLQPDSFNMLDARI